MPRWILFLPLLGLVLASCTADKATLTLTDADIADNNRGVALMGYFDYAGARDVFKALVDRQPEWLDARVNLAIATLNRQQEGDEVIALDLVTSVLERDPANLRAHYVSGILNQNNGNTANAEMHFRAVVEADPNDAYARYYLGQALKQGDRTDEAIEQYRRAIELDPYLRSAYYGAALALRQTGHTDQAAEMLEGYQRFEHNPRARLAELKYTRMGAKAEVAAIDLDMAPTSPPPTGPVFAGAGDVLQLPALGTRSSMTTVDIDGDGVQDFFVTHVGPDDRNAVIVHDNQGFGRSDHPLAAVTAVNAVAWGDFDNDGRVDAYLCRQGPNQLWRQPDAGEWTDVTGQTGTANGQWDCADTLMIDADHDGDLDLFVVNRDGPNELYNNNLDGTFRALADDYGIAGRAGSVQAIAGDLDNDRDLDLIVIKSEPPHEVLLNDRLWQYRMLDETSPWGALAATPISAAMLGDTDTDGRADIYAVSPDGSVVRWAGEGNAVLEPEALIGAPDTAARNTQIALADFDGDGNLDLLRSNSAGWTARSPATGNQLGTDTGALAAVLPVYLAPDKGPELLVAQRDGAIRRYPAGPGRYPFMAMQVSGKEDQADSMRSNRDGLGTRVELRAGSRWTIVDSLDRDSSPGQSLQPLMLGLGSAHAADFVALTWSDGVYQTELNLAQGQLHRIEETQRQLSSCPVLFAWDGEKYQFVTDLLGVGGLGFFVEPGVSATPRPWEYLLLPAGLLQAKDGLLSFRLTEPMEELAYIDSVRLHIYDLPAGVSMVLDERMVIDGPAATGEAFFYDNLMTPIQVLNNQGLDVTATVAEADRVAAPVSELDSRFIGLLAASNVLTLDFAEPLDREPGTPLLIIDGWLEYPYSQTVFAAWQAGAAFEAPTLEAFGRDGYWRTVYRQFGYPAGMPRQMMLPLRDLPPGTMRLRLSTNQEIYWDRIAVAHAVPAVVDHFSTAPISATQRLAGFPQRTTLPQRIPQYDYSRRATFWDTRYPTGVYSQLGSVIDLVQRTDDAVAIIGPGEEVEFAFADPGKSANSPANQDIGGPAADIARHYVIEVRGWAKDMDLYTRDGETVEPLPVRSENDDPDALREALHRRYHTRYQSGR